ncbi:MULTISPECIES: UDP-N-acetylmuramoyl-tripeptide--D-alanyl-D-alanine ligase [unclassified Tenacibaculum]|uniref:UDP-N-acetylmuramoyl-tripeptide--D-alanyl-D- alanine ligase n=1 Tax=unclassified Tenacibaculum TaxID=2635139 RepID=UPI001F2096F9|nr:MULTISPECIES: UDP-N-acetylmuramoyl-tripeptide--D-alanyl-D-alanine ligase [unclassified Tenacibaculum]MCF2876591.1 UDP-N-acetylmuramoyl-tripeptide--D-alanyl-D-alanine ligase [Tenacibaculum sp. Cn5-1]MCF2936742.1 UDP-N-acetylmuramoyl-tripeptide--D-alanyl-D-alanine ligase [Tenacibaculum sp. Cn5-34]MCG7512966.1 UDP-N-acetylmuramoyl-tripeptide--D-alanyl-D-alanine ligase [Tenacibaculum sp. Cn5-46]
MDIKELYRLFIQHGLVDTDTRKIRNNSMFFALKGDNFNGNKFASDALAKGAKYAVVDEIEYKTNDNIILVDNVLKALQDLANYHRNELNIPIISLTGSNGKTTTKELINAVLSCRFKTTATKGNLNNHIGVPLTLLSMNSDTEIGIVEMGANHQKEIAFLSKIVEPNYGYITNFGSAHLEGFRSIEGVIKGKSELYDFIRDSKGKVFLNSKDPIQVEKTKEIDVIRFEESIKFISANPFVSLGFNNDVIYSQLIGSYNFANISAAITIGNYFKVPQKEIKKAIENYIPSNNRSEIIETENNKIILDAYNANPTSMKAALDSFVLYESNHKTVILGDMFELGDYSELEHQKIVNFVSKAKFDRVLLVGKNFFQTETNYQKFKTLDELKKYLQDSPIKGSTILIKGSRGIALENTLPLC